MTRRTMFPGGLSRRDLLRLSALGVLGSGLSGWMPALAQELGQHPARRRHCILLWMPGGPSQLDTFDMKPNHGNGGEFKERETSVPGMRFSEHLPKMAELAKHLAIVRSLNTKEGDHDRGTYLVRTGRQLGGPVQFPTIGSALAKQLGDDTSELPQYVTVAPTEFLSPAAFSPGSLGPKYAPATVSAINPPGPMNPPANAPANPNTFARLGLDYLQPSSELSHEQVLGRSELWSFLQTDFLAGRAAHNALVHDTVYRRAMRLMTSPAASAFDLSEESDAVRERYGRGLFGQGCLLARRLIERGVPFVEVSLSGNGGLAWDTHANNFPSVKTLCSELDAGWSTLITELDERGLLEDTTMLWVGEFGRTPNINAMSGRDHFPTAWSCVLAGGGVQGGTIHGKTSDDGMEVVDGKIGIGELLATLCAALGVDPSHENQTEIGRPIKIIEAAPIKSLIRA